MHTHTHFARGFQSWIAGIVAAAALFGLVPLPQLGYAQTSGVCGDGLRNVPQEECDDGNLVNGDGCNNQCLTERCGDGRLMEPEQCDDGNAVTGDGCSAACFIEYCGDGRIQELRGENCDDGNVIGGDGCSAQCVLEDKEEVADEVQELCGYTDDKIQTFNTAYRYFQIITGPPHPKYTIVTKWTPDDIEFVGMMMKHYINFFPFSCTDYELLVKLIRNAGLIRVPIRQPEPPIVPPVTEPPVQTTIPPTSSVDPASGGTRGTREEQVQTASEFLSSATGQGVYDRLTPEAKERLQAILTKYAQGRGLSQEELAWIISLSEQIQLAREAESRVYTDLLKRFTSTDIVQAVLEENQLLRARLVDVEVPIAIQELERAVAIVQRGELKEEVMRAVGRLRRQRVPVDDTPITVTDAFSDAARPVTAFAALTALKEGAEAYATPSIPASADTIVAEAQKIRAALPYLEEEYALPVDQVEALLRLIEIRAVSIHPQSTDRFIATVNRLIALLQRSGITLPDDPLVVALLTSEAVARADRIVGAYGPNTFVASLLPTEPKPQTHYDKLSTLTRISPAQYRQIFETGDLPEQREALKAFLQTNERVQSLRAELRQRGEADDRRYDALLAQIGRVGITATTDTPCDDTMTSAFDCTNDYLFDLQTSVRAASLWTRIVGGIQDVLGM